MQSPNFVGKCPMGIKIKDLLEVFKNADPEDSIHVVMGSGCCGDTEFLDVDSVDHRQNFYSKRGDKNFYSFIQIQCDSIEGYGSCGQVAATKRNHKQHWLKKNGHYRPWAKITDMDLAQAIKYADSHYALPVGLSEDWLEHFKQAIGMSP